jgi:hypothetical protein
VNSRDAVLVLRVAGIPLHPSPASVGYSAKRQIFSITVSGDLTAAGMGS